MPGGVNAIVTFARNTGIDGASIVAPVVHYDALLGQNDEIVSYALRPRSIDQLRMRVVALARWGSNLDDDQRSIERH